ncbi:MAG: TlpA family protein disulfide reductase [Clostridia bacterium]|nr:TlpA family protein disulfide reductase [Clostridia bacterium]
MTRRWTTWLALGVLLLALVGALLFSRGGGRPRLGSTAPDFTLERLDGGTLRLADLRGKAVLINFWTSWCPPCREETPALAAFAQRYGREVVVLGVDVAETAATVRAYVRSSGIGYPVLLDRDKSISNLYGLTGYPESWFVSPDGRLSAFYSGPLTFEEMQSLAARALGRPLDAGGVGPVRPGDRLMALAAAPDGGLAVVTGRGRWERARDGRWILLTSAPAGEGGQVPGGPQARSADGRWLVRWQPGRGLLAGPPEGPLSPLAGNLPADAQVTALAVETTPEGGLARIWVGTAGGLFLVAPDGRTRAVSGFDRSAESLLVLGSGRLLVASDRGLWQAEAASASARTVEAPARAFVALTRAGGYLWAGAPNGDLYRSQDGERWEWSP